MKYIRSHLSIKLVLSYLVVVLVGMSVVGITARFVTPRAFDRHLSFMEEQIGADLGARPGSMMGHGQGKGGEMLSEFYLNYQATFNESLMSAVLAASFTAMVVGFIFSQRILAPVQNMKNASQRIAEGHYDERVQVSGDDELGQLAGSFNQMAEELEQIEIMRRRLIGDVAHELRTPLTAIKGSAEGLLDGVLPPTDETFRQIQSESERLSRLVDDLQELSRVESRVIQLDIHSVDLKAIIQMVLRRIRYQFDENFVKVTSNLPLDTIHILADEDRLVQILTNLIGNALHYTHKNGEVIISVESDKNKALISIRDNGIGIPPEDLGRIFERFYRVDKSRTRARGGSGIGLTIAKHLVEAHGGKIWAESEGANKGSTFVFSMPLVK